jgi:hypothetical protein
VPVEHGKAEVFPIAKVVEEGTLRDLGRLENRFQLCVVVALERDQAGRCLEDPGTRLKRPRLLDIFHRSIRNRVVGMLL